MNARSGQWDIDGTGCLIAFCVRPMIECSDPWFCIATWLWPQVEAEAKPLPTDSREPADTAADVVKLDADCDASPADLADLALG